MREVGARLHHRRGDVYLEVGERITLLEGRHHIDAAEAADIVANETASPGEERDAALGELPPRIDEKWVLRCKCGQSEVIR